LSQPYSGSSSARVFGCTLSSARNLLPSVPLARVGSRKGTVAETTRKTLGIRQTEHSARAIAAGHTDSISVRHGAGKPQLFIGHQEWGFRDSASLQFAKKNTG
jgi:hypothetical protein